MVIWREILALEISRLPLKADARVLSLSEMRAEVDECASVANVDAFEELKCKWTSCCATGSSLATSLTTLASDVVQHLHTKQRETKREKARLAMPTGRQR